MNKIYAGIGSRSVPDTIINKIFKLSIFLSEIGFTLRSGGAPGCDSAFEVGCESVRGKKEIYIPWKNFENRYTAIVASDLENFEDAIKISMKHHPAWYRLPQPAKLLHTRNVYQILGRNLNSPVDFVVCYTQDGKSSGGTGQAMRISESLNIPIYNLYFDDVYNKVKNLKNEK
jgi:hypothetical protein